MNRSPQLLVSEKYRKEEARQQLVLLMNVKKPHTRTADAR
jgi:hypothetical protein